MLIPKFYISKTKEVTDTEIIWNYAVSKHKLDDTYYLPSNFVDEGVDNNQHIELPYVLVGKYEAGSNGLIGNDEMLVSKPGLMPRVCININDSRTLISKYNNNDIQGYQHYDIHVHDLITMLFAIEYKTMNSQSIMRGYVDNVWETGQIATGNSTFVKSSSGTLSNDGHNSFNYRGIENLWGNIWKYTDGVNFDQINGTKTSIHTAKNSRFYSSDSITEYYSDVLSYEKLELEGYVLDTGFDKNIPFLNMPTKVGGDISIYTGDYYYQDLEENINIFLTGGYWFNNDGSGINSFSTYWDSLSIPDTSGTRILRIPLRN